MADKPQQSTQPPARRGRPRKKTDSAATAPPSLSTGVVIRHPARTLPTSHKHMTQAEVLAHTNLRGRPNSPTFNHRDAPDEIELGNKAVARPQGIPQQRPMGEPVQYVTVAELAKLEERIYLRLDKSSKANTRYWDEHFKPVRRDASKAVKWIGEEDQRRERAAARARRLSNQHKAFATRAIKKLKGMRLLKKDRN